MDYENYQVEVEPDNDIPGKWMVVIYQSLVMQPKKSERTLVGIPLRGVDELTAERSQKIVAWSFEYGVRAHDDFVRRLIHRTSPTIAVVFRKDEKPPRAACPDRKRSAAALKRTKTAASK